MSPKKKKKTWFFSAFSSELILIFRDVLFAYKNFIHWSISRLYISSWSLLLGIIVALPMFLLWITLGFIDAIDWLDIVKASVSNTDPEYLKFLGGIASYPYSLVAMIFIMTTSALFFLLAGTYSLFLNARLSLKYIEAKKLDYAKNLYFSRKYIVAFLALISWNMVYILVFISIWLSFLLLLYIMYNIGFLGFESLSLIAFWLSLLFLWLMSYVIYRILFGYIILADTWKKHDIKPARYYIKKSMKLTSGKSYWKFLVIMLLYFIILSPFKSIDVYLTNQLNYMKDTIAFRSGLIETVEPKEVKYYEYITAEYAEFADNKIIERIVLFSRIKLLYFFISYFLFTGLFVLIMSSYYKRVLNKK